MAKISTISGQQRLLQLARSQLGDAVTPAAVRVATGPEPQQKQFSDRHQQLTARSGAVISEAMTVSERVARRLKMQRERQQLNLEKIMALAAEYCTESVSAQEVDADWFQQFCELVLDISNNSMQQLWAKILAGEIATPGKFSLKTLHTLKSMSYKEALALQQAAHLTARSRQEPASARIYFGYIRKPSVWRWLTGRSKAILNLSQFGLTYSQILSLMEIGLLHSSEIESGELTPGQKFSWQYQQTALSGTANNKGVVLQYYKYTASGAELLPLLSSQPNQSYLQALRLLLTDVMMLD